ncbi:P-loop containing nucleoside triphosphate hydrolase protein, partial [Leptodontidium sp. 2 PMI_412]
YSEGKDKAMKRLREEIDKASKGFKREDFSVPFSLSDVSDVEHFVARKTELVEIHKALSGDGSRRLVVLHGLGGIGKTQLSAAYAKQHKDSYSAIFWLNIKDEDSLKQSFIKVAKQISRNHSSGLRLSNMDTSEALDEVVDTVKAWLSLPNNTRWLIIYDNYDNPKLPGKTDPAAVDIRMFLPESYQGSIIITTRSSQVKLGHPIQIRKLGDVRDSLEILSTVSRRQELISDPDAVNLAKELDGLPLALATAGAYLDQTTRSFSDYLRLYRESWLRLMETSPELSSYEDRTLYSTWHISYKSVKQQNPLSANLLRLWAYFDNQDLWFELLRHGDSEDPEWLRELTKDEVSFDSAVRVLNNYGLVEVATSSQESIDSKGYSIHGCVHSWTIHALNQEWDCDLARLAVKFVGAHVPRTNDIQPWPMQLRLLQHAARCSYMVLNSLVVDEGLAHEYHNLGLLYADQGKLVEAEQMYQRALQGKEKAWGPDHTSTLDTAWGPDHTSTLDTVNNLGLLYADQGKLVEAEQMYQRALQGYEKAIGLDNITTYVPALNTISNLGLLFERQADLAKARTMFSKALRGYEQVFGPDH